MGSCQIYIPDSLLRTTSQQWLNGVIESTPLGVKFFILDSSSKFQGSRSIGLIAVNPEGSDLKLMKNSYIVFKSNPRDDQNVLLHKIEVMNKKLTIDNVEIIAYPKQMYHLERSDFANDNYEDFVKLSNLLRKFKSSNLSNLFKKFVSKFEFLSVSLIIFVNLIGKLISKVHPAFKNMAITQHFSDWKRVWNGGKAIKNGQIWVILIDILLGTALIVWIHSVGNPGQYVMDFTHEIVYHLRKLLEGLRGSPVGLKINGHLNDFLLNCFIYHVNLWGTFLEIVSPAINYLFLTLSTFGFYGLTFQMAMLSDLLVLITIHAHCFYIYAAVLYRLEVIGLKALWRVVLGRRRNVLKNRVESHEYEKQQLFLATMFFATLLFLLPTVLVYYVVFATLRLGSYCITYTLLVIRRKLLLFPICLITRWLIGIHICAENTILELLDYKNLKTESCKIDNILAIRVKFQSSIRWATENEVQFDNNYMSIGQFLKELIAGEIKGFIHPKSTS